MSIRAGVIAVQGDVSEHARAIERAAAAHGKEADVVEIRTAGHVPDCDVLLLPGGESTTISESLLTFFDINSQLGTNYGPGDNVLTGFQVGQDLNPNEPPEPVIEDQLAEEIAIIPEVPEVTVSNLSLAGQGSDATLVAGTHDVTVEMTHVGGGAGDVQVNLTIGEATQTRTVSIAVDETLTVTFENATSGLEPGYYDVAASALGGAVTGDLLLSVDANGDGQPATDTSGDNLLNNVDGDDAFDIFDVQTFFTNFNSDAVQASPALFNFNGDDPPVVTIFDVQALFTQLAAES